MRRFWIPILSGMLAWVLGPLTTMAQTTGHMLDQVEYLPGMPKSYVTLKGQFDPALFSQVQIETDDAFERSNIVIPNAFINSVMMKDRNFGGFPADGLLAALQIQEQLSRADDGQIEFAVNLGLTTSVESTVALDPERSNGQQLTLVLMEVPRRTPEIPVASEDNSLVEQGSLPSMAQPGLSAREAVLLHPVAALFAYQPPLQLNLSILNASPHVSGAQRLAILLERQQRRALEDRLGMKLAILNISSVREDVSLLKTKIYFRPNFLKAALALAELIPGEQVVEPMPLSRTNKMGTDVEIYVGENFE
jgi:hypothetical protein